jgi:cobalt/nickel transport system permease protein
MDRAGDAEAAAARIGWLQDLDPRVKVVGLLSLVAAGAFARSFPVLLCLLGLAVGLALLSGLPFRWIFSRSWLAAVSLGVVLAVPAMVFTPGAAVATIPGTTWPVTREGVTVAGLLMLRTTTAVTLGFVLAFTTRWPHVLKALRTLRVPLVFVVVLSMTSRYIVLLLESAHDLFEGRRSRTVGVLAAAERRRAAAESAGVLLSRSLDLSGEVYLAMQARGFRGDVYVLDDFTMRAVDWMALAGLVAVAATAVWMGR